MRRQEEIEESLVDNNIYEVAADGQITGISNNITNEGAKQ